MTTTPDRVTPHKHSTSTTYRIPAAQALEALGITLDSGVKSVTLTGQIDCFAAEMVGGLNIEVTEPVEG